MTETSPTPKNFTGFVRYAASRIILGLVLAVIVIGLLAYALPLLDRYDQAVRQAEAPVESVAEDQSAVSDKAAAAIKEIAMGGADASPAPTAETDAAATRTATDAQAAAPAEAPAQQPKDRSTDHTTATLEETSAAAAPSTQTDAVRSFPKVGMAFVDAAIAPLDYELNERFWGWRPNDIVEFTDNINNFQLGVLEVTRRTAVALTERLSRTGSTDALDPNLQNAMNWFMIKADRYWFPSAESKYKAGLKEMRVFFNKLEAGSAAFYTRTDNLIPLLTAYEDLLGSCDENLVKDYEEDGRKVSYFKADNYFFYAKGIASAMLGILEAIQQDFDIMVSREGGMEVLHHAIASCRKATEIDPWLILNSGKDSIFANHRANMAAPISHARFYLGVLIKTLST